MGDDYNLVDEQPRHQVFVPSFYMEKTEIPIRLWVKVRDWAIEKGYEFSKEQSFPHKIYTISQGGSYMDFPMNNMNWFDCVKWCNARSEFMGRKPVYYLDSSLTNVYRSGEVHLNFDQIDQKASGYRLPTEAEWEKAARGVVRNFSQNYPWGAALNGSVANYKLSGDPYDDGTTPIAYYNSNQLIETREFSFGGENQRHENIVNAYGFYDIIGNVSEWCWDWYEESGYNRPKYSISSDPYGPNFTYDETNMNDSDKRKWKFKVHRGGGYKSDPEDEGNVLRIAFRDVEFATSSRKTLGLRTTRRVLVDKLWFDQVETIHNKWYILDWFGYFYDSGLGWVYHTNYGWIYPFGEGSYDNWIYIHHKGGWVWTSKFYYPWFYNHVDSTWYEDLSQSGEIGFFRSDADSSKHKWGNGF